MRALVGLTLVLLLAACGGQPTTSSTPETTAPADLSAGRADVPVDTPTAADAPPDVVVSGGSQTLELRPWTYCWGTVCADGYPPDPLDDAGHASELVVEFPEPGMTFEAGFQRSGEECARTHSADVERLSNNTYRLVPLGPADTYDVHLIGKGDGGGLSVSFQWTTTEGGPVNQPRATVEVLSDTMGEVGSLGVGLSVVDLAATTTEASAEITVTAADGNQLSIEPKLTRPKECAVEGELSWQASATEGLEAAQLGDPPFAYTVTLILDGTTYVGTATWPEDVDPECDPCTPLVFEPPLPGL